MATMIATSLPLHSDYGVGLIDDCHILSVFKFTNECMYQDNIGKRLLRLSKIFQKVSEYSNIFVSDKRTPTMVPQDF